MVRLKGVGHNHKSDDEISALIKAMQPDAAKSAKSAIMDKYFIRSGPIACALRVCR